MSKLHCVHVEFGYAQSTEDCPVCVFIRNTGKIVCILKSMKLNVQT